MSPDFTCPHCGGRQSSHQQSKCDYCGGLLELGPDAQPAAEPPTHSERFAALKTHPRYPELLEHEPQIGSHVVGGGCLIAFLFVWTLLACGFAIGGGMATAGAGMFAAPFMLIPGAMAVFGVTALVYLFKRIGRFKVAPWRRVPAVVLGRRTRNTSETSRSYVTLEFEDGEREEFPIRGSEMGTLAEGDVGVAFLKAEHLVEFERVRL